MFPIPDQSKLDAMNEDLSKIVPKDMSGVVNLMAHPVAGAAAMSALGLGLASHAFGLWMGAISGAAEASQRLLQPLLDDATGGLETFTEKEEAPAQKTRKAALTLVPDVQTFTKNVADATSEATREVVEAAEEAIANAQGIAETAVAAMTSIPAVVETLTELMPEDFRKPLSLERPETPDDLKTISGIGPKLEQVLNGMGIWTFGQIAAWTREEIAWMDDTLGFKGRIGRDDWLGQASRLLTGSETRH